VQYMQQCYNQQLLQQQMQQQQVTGSAVNPHGQSPSHTDYQRQPLSPATYSNAGTSTQPETNISEPQNRKSLPNGLQRSDAAADAAISSEFPDEDDGDAS